MHKGFHPDGYYGSWLKEKPLVIVINEQLFTHGGLSATVGKMGLTGVNETLLQEMKDYAALWYDLIDAGLFIHYLPHLDRVNFAQALVDGKIKNKRLQKMSVIKKAVRFLEVADTIISKPESPVWYRGTALCHQFSEEPLVNSVLAAFDVNSAYLGHSVTDSHEVESRFEGRVFLQDTGILKKA